MTPETKILIWWFLFGGTHILGSSVPVRTFLIRKLGLPGFKGVYSLVAFATFIPLCYVYGANKHTGALLFSSSPFLQALTQILMFFAIIILAQGLVTPTPIATLAEMSGEFPSGARGIQRLTRHPQNFAFALFGAGHLLSNPFVGDWIFFGGFILYSILSAIHQDKRSSATGREEVRRFQSETSAVPFAAILGGRQGFALGEYNLVALVVSVVLFILLWMFHGKFFGGFDA